MLALSGAGSDVSLFSFTTVIVLPVGITSAGIDLAFLVTNGIVRLLLKTMGKKK